MQRLRWYKRIKNIYLQKPEVHYTTKASVELEYQLEKNQAEASQITGNTGPTIWM